MALLSLLQELSANELSANEISANELSVLNSLLEPPAHRLVIGHADILVAQHLTLSDMAQ